MPGTKKIKTNSIPQAVEVLKQGGVVVFPTETAYGLAADATNTKAVRRVFAIKGRSKEKTLPLIVADFKIAEKYAIFLPLMKKIVKKYWPGPLTVVVPVRMEARNKNFCSLSRGVVRDGTIAVRVSSHPVAKTLARHLGRPIVSTSANLIGQPACYSVAAVKKQLGTKPDFYLDVGRLNKNKPSTIIKEAEGKIIVLRQGEISIVE